MWNVKGPSAAKELVRCSPHSPPLAARRLSALPACTSMPQQQGDAVQAAFVRRMFGTSVQDAATPAASHAALKGLEAGACTQQVTSAAQSVAWVGSDGKGAPAACTCSGSAPSNAATRKSSDLDKDWLRLYVLVTCAGRRDTMSPGQLKAGIDILRAETRFN